MTTYRHAYKRSDQPNEWERPIMADWRKLDTHSSRHWFKMYWATPPWLSDEQVKKMKNLYESANPKTHHIDHIVPLKSKLVCGLNVPWNLEKLGVLENLLKSNHMWPDHPNESLCLGLDFKQCEFHQMSLGL